MFILFFGLWTDNIIILLLKWSGFILTALVLEPAVFQGAKEQVLQVHYCFFTSDFC